MRCSPASWTPRLPRTGTILLATLVALPTAGLLAVPAGAAAVPVERAGGLGLGSAPLLASAIGTLAHGAGPARGEPAACRSSASAAACGLAPVASQPASGGNNSSVSGTWVAAPSVAPNGSALPFPSLRDQAAMAYDPSLGAVVLFGGYNPNRLADGDTWLFDNNTWTDISGSLLNSPPARWGDRLVWDAADGYLMLFGGRNMTQYFNDTWAFTGATWLNLTTTVAPSPRGWYQMAYDALDGYVLLYGGWIGNDPAGTNSSQQVFSDTWSYVGGVWTNLTASVAGAPGPLAHGAMAYDPVLGESVLYGGVAEATFPWACTPDNDAFGYASGTWRNLTGTVGAAIGPLSSVSMVYADPIGELFLFGGVYPTASGGCDSENTTYEFTSGQTTATTDPAGPMGRDEDMLAYDPAENATVLFGGNVNNGGPYLFDTWLYEFNASSGSGGSGGSSGGSGGSGNGGGNGSGNPGTGGSGGSAVPFRLSASASTYAGATPLVVTFSAVPVGSTGPWSYRWSFGDGEIATGPSYVQHTYLSAGTFHPVVVVTDARGDSESVNLSAIAVSGSVGRALVPAAAAPSSSGGPLMLAFLVAGALAGSAAVGAVLVSRWRREDRTEGEALVRALADPDGSETVGADGR